MKKFINIVIVLCGLVACASQPQEAEIPVAQVTIPVERATETAVSTNTAVPPTIVAVTSTSIPLLSVIPQPASLITRRPDIEEYDLSTPTTSTPTPVPTPTPSPTPTYTPATLHPLAISPDNVDQIAEISQLGRGTIHKMALSPDGETVAVVGGLGVWLYDLDTLGLVQFVEQPHMVNVVDWSPDGTRLVWGGEDSMVHVWNIATGEELQTWDNFNSPIWSLSWSGDGQKVVVGTVAGGLWIWQADTGKLIHQFGIGEYGRVWGISWSPDNVQFASAHEDGMVRIWDVFTGNLVFTFEAHHIPNTYYGGSTIYHGALSVAWSPNGQFIASSGSDDHKLRLWNAGTGEEIVALRTHSSTVIYSLAWSSDGSQLALAGDRVGVLEIDSLEEQTFEGEYLDPIHSLVWAADGDRLLSAGVDATMKVWDVQSGGLTQTLPGHTKPVWSIAWSPDGGQLAAGSNDANIWEISTAELLTNLVSTETYYRLNSLAWSPDGSKLAWAEGEYGGAARIWNVITEQFIERTEDGWGFGNGESSVYKVAWTFDNQLLISPWHHSDWSPDNLLVAVGHAQEIHVYDMKTGENLFVLPGHEAITLDIAWSPDGKWIASSGSHDKTIRIWDADTGTEQKEIVGNVTYDKLTWSPDAALLLGVNRNQVYIWETANWQEMGRIELGSGVLSIEFSPDGRFLAIGSHDGTVRLWGIP